MKLFKKKSRQVMLTKRKTHRHVWYPSWKYYPTQGACVYLRITSRDTDNTENKGVYFFFRNKDGKMWCAPATRKGNSVVKDDSRKPICITDVYLTEWRYYYMTVLGY